MRAVLRRLLESPGTQADVTADLGCNQSTASRAIGTLRSLALVEDDGAAQPIAFRVSARDEVLAVFLAADRLAEALLQREVVEQKAWSEATRRLAIRPAADDSAKETS